MEKIKITFQKLTPNAVIPEYKTKGSSGFDFTAAEEEMVPAKGVTVIATGLRAEIPEGYEIQIRPRSGLAAKYGISVLNAPATIDSDYRGEIKIILFNFSSNSFQVKKGMRIAQGVIAKIEQAEIKEGTVKINTERGEGGFGSTGM